MAASPLEESTAAAIGALGATLALAPLDVAKVRIQADKSGSTAPKRGTLATVVAIAREEGAQQLLVGVGPKAAVTVLSNFAFYYFFESLKRLYKRAGLTSGTVSSLLIGSLAGVLNVCATHPMETVATRLQAGGRQMPETCASACRHIMAESGPTGFWRGFTASLMLVANPAINVTVFDALKARLLTALGRLRGQPVHSLSVGHAFVLGCLAKAVATLLTYPLIRVKVLQQAAKQASSQPQPPFPPIAGQSPGRAQPQHGAVGHGSGGAGQAPPQSVRSTSESTAALLQRIWAEDGVRGLYVGCSAQLLTTVLKAGLLLMGKEKALALALALLRPQAGRVSVTRRQQ